MGVRAQHGGHAAIQVPAHGHFFAGGLGVEVHHDDLGTDTGQKIVDGVEGVAGGVHEDAALQVDHRVVHAALGGSLVNAVTGKTGLEICRPQHAACAFLAVDGR